MLYRTCATMALVRVWLGLKAAAPVPDISPFS